MSHLVLEIKAGERLKINGADILFKTKAKVALPERYSFLVGKQILPEEAIVTPGQRLYYAIQQAYVGNPHEHLSWMNEARSLAFSASLSAEEAGTFKKAFKLAEEQKYYPALVCLRELLREQNATAKI